MKWCSFIEFTRALSSIFFALLLLVVMAAAVGTFAATYGETTDRSQVDQALYSVGTDVRLGNLGRLDRESSDATAKALLEFFAAT